MSTQHQFEFNMTTKNSNFQKSAYSLPKRRNSRQSTEAFNNIDFQCIGNTNEVNHLIQKNVGGASPNPCQLDFELNLRNYKSQSQFKGAEPWIYPKTKKFKPVETDKSFFPQLAKLSKKSASGAAAEGEADPNNQFTNRGNDEARTEGVNSKKKVQKPYSDIFREKNMQKVRHLFEK